MISKKQLKKIKLILQEQQVSEEEKQVNDEVGKFYVVEKPFKGCKKEDIVFERTVFDECNKDKTIGVFKNRSEANRTATEELKKYEDGIKDLKEKMNSFREQKQALEQQKNETKELVNKLK